MRAPFQSLAFLMAALCMLAGGQSRAGSTFDETRRPGRRAPGDAVVAGVVRFEKLVVDDAGLHVPPANAPLDQRRFEPADGVMVEVVDAVSRRVLASAEADDRGNYEVTVAAGTPLNRRRTVYARVLARTERISVLHRTARLLYAVRGPLFRLRSDRLNAQDFGILDRGRASGPFNILHAIRRGEEALGRTGGIVLPPTVTVYWDTVDSGGAFADAPNNAIYLSGDRRVNSDEFDDSVTLHEYGHLIAHALSRDDSPGGLHRIGERVDPRLAWSEGWATYFASAVLEDPHYRDSESSGLLLLRLEDLRFPGESPNYASEFSVGSCLWHIHAAGGPEFLGQGFSAVFGGFRRLTAARFVYLVDFLDAFLPASAVDQQAFKDFLLQYEIRYRPFRVPSVENPFPAPIRCRVPLTGVADSLEGAGPPPERPRRRQGRTNLESSSRFFEFFQRAAQPEMVRVELQTQAGTGTPPDAQLQLVLLTEEGHQVEQLLGGVSVGARRHIETLLPHGRYVIEVRSSDFSYFTGRLYDRAGFELQRSHPGRDAPIFDLGTLRPDPDNPSESLGISQALAISRDAPILVTGTADAPGGVSRAFVWDERTRAMRDAGPGPGSTGRGINTDGETCGEALFPPAEGSRAFRTHLLGGAPDLFLLPHAPDEMMESAAFGISETGIVVGSSTTALAGFDGTVRHRRYGFRASSPGAEERLETLVRDPDPESPFATLGGSAAFAVNRAGMAVGQATSPAFTTHAVFWPAGSSVATDLGTLITPGGLSAAFGVNDSGQIVGHSTDTTGPMARFRATIWENGTIQALDTRPHGVLEGSTAYAINEGGFAVGIGRFAPTLPLFRAVLWQRNAQGGWDEIQLKRRICPDEGWELEEARGISNQGWVVGSGLRNGTRRAFLLKVEGAATRSGRGPARARPRRG